MRVDLAGGEGHIVVSGTQGMTRRVVLLGLAVAAAGPAGADEVFVRGGGRLTGQVVQHGPDAIVVDIGSGQIGLPLSHVDRIVPGETPVGMYRRRAEGLAADDVAGRLALGAWARAHDLETNAREAFESVLAVDPANVAAQRALGHVRFDGQWMTRDESYLARGYVRFDGAWVTSEERRAAIDERRAAAEERRARAEAHARIREAEARARVAEAEALRAEVDLARTAAEPGYGQPELAGLGWTPWVTGTFGAPVFYSAFAYPAPARFGVRSPSGHGFARRHHVCRPGCRPRSPAPVRSLRSRGALSAGRASRPLARPGPSYARAAAPPHRSRPR
jgi:hypothetical protein